MCVCLVLNNTAATLRARPHISTAVEIRTGARRSNAQAHSHTRTHPNTRTHTHTQPPPGPRPRLICGKCLMCTRARRSVVVVAQLGATRATRPPVISCVTRHGGAPRVHMQHSLFHVKSVYARARARFFRACACLSVRGFFGKLTSPVSVLYVEYVQSSRGRTLIMHYIHIHTYTHTYFL